MMVKRLRGNNQTRKFRQVADALTSEIAANEGIAGILFIGGLARGFMDKHSDLDIVVFLDKRNKRLATRIHEIGSKGKSDSRIDVDLLVHSLKDFMQWKLSEADRWEFSRAKIVFDPNGEVRKAFTKILALPRDFWLKRIATYAEYLKWYCCPLEEGTGTISKAWIDRGDLTSAHYCLNYGVNLIVNTVFALNKELLPAPKWRLFYSFSLKWRPEGYGRLIRQAMIVEKFSVEEYNRRSKVIKNLWERLRPKIEEQTGLPMAQLTRYYVEQILLQEGTNSRSEHKKTRRQRDER